MAALAKVLPRTMVASRSCGSASRRATALPVRGWRSANCRTCHLLREKREVSASEKKKLAPAKTRTTTTATIGAAIMGGGWRKVTVKAKGKTEGGGGLE